MKTLFLENDNVSLTFETLSGDLVAKRQGEFISLDLPSAPPVSQVEHPSYAVTEPLFLFSTQIVNKPLNFP